MPINTLRIKLRKPNTTGIFHNSREDVRTLMIVCDKLIDKVNELTNKVNELERKLEG